MLKLLGGETAFVFGCHYCFLFIFISVNDRIRTYKAVKPKAICFALVYTSALLYRFLTPRISTTLHNTIMFT